MGIVEETIALIYKVQSQDDLRAISNALNGRFRALGHVVAQKAVESKDIRPGSFVSFTARGRKVYGTVKTINPKSCTIEPNGGILYGPNWRVSPGLLTKEESLPPVNKSLDHLNFSGSPKAIGSVEEKKVILEIQRIYGNLSPENLTCDGELSHAQVMRRKRELNDALETCFFKLGRRMTEEEAYKVGAT